MPTISGARPEAAGWRAAQGTITADQQLFYGSGTWNNAAVTFQAQVLEITDSASGAGSLLANWRVGGASKFNVTKAGALTLGAGITTGGQVRAPNGATGILGSLGRGGFETTADGAWDLLNEARSLYGTLRMKYPIAAAAVAAVGAGEIGYGGTTQTTIGANGAASALTANPVGYIIVNVAGSNRIVPFYNP